MNELISQYYDNEFNDSELLNFEAKLAKSKTLNEYCNKNYDLFYKISQSINLVKGRINLCLDKKQPKINFNHKKGIFNRFVYRFFEEFL